MSKTLYTHFTKSGQAAAPLVFAFHGTGGSESQFGALAAQILPDAMVVAPRGDVSERGAKRFFRRQAEGRYDMDDLAYRTDRMIKFIAAHIKANPERPVYGVGYSNGANILASVLFQSPQLFDRAALLHPLVPWKPKLQPELKGRSVLVTAGRRDPICPLRQSEALATWFRAQGTKLELALYGGGHDISREELHQLGIYLRKA